MAAAIMATMQLIFGPLLFTDTHTQIKLDVCASKRLSFVCMYQSSLAKAKIPPVVQPGALGTSGAAVEHMRLNCVRVPVTQ